MLSLLQSSICSRPGIEINRVLDYTGQSMYTTFAGRNDLGKLKRFFLQADYCY